MLPLKASFTKPSLNMKRAFSLFGALCANLVIASLIASLACAQPDTGGFGVMPLSRGGTNSKTGSITGSGALTFTAGGANNDINLTPAGTGGVVVSTSNGVRSAAGFWLSGGSNTGGTGIYLPSSNVIAFWANNAEKARLAQSGNWLFGNTTDGTGKIQLLGTSGTSTDGITFATDLNFYRYGAGSAKFDTASGTAVFAVANSGTMGVELLANGVDGYITARGNMNLRSNSGTTFLTGDSSQNVQIVKTVTSYNGIATAGNGLSSVQAAGRFTAQTAAKASVATYTLGASDASFIVSANVLVTTATSHNFTVTCAYTDEGNTARTLTFNFSSLAGVLATTIINTGGAVPYEGVPAHIRCKASTAITIATTGTFTTVTYNVEGIIQKVQ